MKTALLLIFLLFLSLCLLAEGTRTKRQYYNQQNPYGYSQYYSTPTGYTGYSYNPQTGQYQSTSFSQTYTQYYSRPSYYGQNYRYNTGGGGGDWVATVGSAGHSSGVKRVIYRANDPLSALGGAVGVILGKKK